MTGVELDTIAAISTPPGRSGTALVRVSGPGSREVARRLGIECGKARVARVRVIRHPDTGEAVDRGLATFFEGPASFTGEDMLEISGHGGVLVPALVLDAVLAAGARTAEPGEFTRRAYLHGKLDLVQVEAIQDLIEAGSAARHRAALFQLEGGLSDRVEALRTRALELEALLSYDIDFPEEDDGPVPRGLIVERARALASELRRMLRLAPEGERLKEGVLTVLAGRPNAGKSSIFNSLLGSQRAIVTEVPGTTRDAIEAETGIEGFPFRLVDTAGVREGAGAVERIGIEVARRYLEHAGVVLLCVEAGRGWSGDEAALVREARERGAAVVVARTKADLAAAEREDGAADGDVGVPDGLGSVPEVRTSVRSGEGLAELRERLVEACFAGLRASGEPALITRRRHARALRRGAEEVERFVERFAEGHPAEIAGTHLRDAVGELEAVIGITDVEDVLDVIFSSFCVGK